MNRIAIDMMQMISSRPDMKRTATDWATEAMSGPWTEQKFWRRVDAVTYLAKHGYIHRHDDCTYAAGIKCSECD